MFTNNAQGQTKILVTHALHLLPQVDCIYTIADGRIMEYGAYTELMKNGGAFSKYVNAFGSKQEEERGGKGGNGPCAITTPGEKFEKGRTIMQEEERNVGAVTWKVYKTYLAAGNGYVLAPAFLFSLLLVQGSRLMSSYWLVFWQEQQFHRPVGFYVRNISLFLSLLALTYSVR